MDPLVSAAWLARHLGDVIVCHVGTTMTDADPYVTYLSGHVPGARFVSLDDTLAAPAAPIVGRHPLPTADAFAAGLGAIGVDNDAMVVGYDDRGGAFAGRLVWMLRTIGQDAALLDGGLAAWSAPPEPRPPEPRSLESGPVGHDAVDRTVVDWPAAFLTDADDVQAHLDAGGVVVDSREAPRYRGDVEPIDAIAGHIPGAINLPYSGNLVDGRFRPVAELVERFAAVRVDPDAIVYCGSGVTACHNALAIEAAGHPPPRVYVGSWSGWSTEPGRPIAKR